jgi:AAHS family 3-hydroxyphenylpropionic acid transporter
MRPRAAPHAARTATAGVDRVTLLYALTFYVFYVMALSGIAAPFLAAEFGFDESQITGIAGWIALGAFGTALLTRFADRHGRRRIIVLCFAAIPPFAGLTVLATGVASYVLPQIAVNAFVGALATGLAVAVAEQAPDEARARAQSRFGVFATWGGALALAVSSLLPLLPGGWRVFWVVAALPVVAVPLVRARLLETDRFHAARESGRVAAARVRDLLAPPYRGRALGLLAVALLKPVSLTAVGTWPFFHMVKTLGMAPGWASLVYVVGGGIGLAGNPLGARLADRWGRRPTSLAATAATVVAGCAFFFVPPGSNAQLLPPLIALMAANQVATAIFSVADRCIDAELFPTALRSTFLGGARFMNAAGGVFSMFALSWLARPLGGLPTAIAAVSAATLVPALLIFLAVVPETRGQTLEQASRETS